MILDGITELNQPRGLVIDGETCTHRTHKGQCLQVADAVRDAYWQFLAYLRVPSGMKGGVRDIVRLRDVRQR